MVNLEMSTMAISATTCLMELACASLGIRTAGPVFSTRRSGSRESGRRVGAEPNLYFVEGGSVIGRVTVGGVTSEGTYFLLEKQ